MSIQHGNDVIDIFNYYIENSFAAYRESKLPYEAINVFLEMTKGYPSYVIKDNERNKVLGFCFLRPYNLQPAFSETAEITYFIDKDESGKGIGKEALEFLEAEGRKIGIKHIMASISAPNLNSIKFHIKSGFSEAGRFKNIAKKNGQCFDIVWMQKDIE